MVGILGSGASLLTTLSGGPRLITATVIEIDGVQATDEITVTNSEQATEDGAESVVVGFSGGPASNKHLDVVDSVGDNFGQPVSGSVVTVVYLFPHVCVGGTAPKIGALSVNRSFQLEKLRTRFIVRAEEYARY